MRGRRSRALAVGRKWTELVLALGQHLRELVVLGCEDLALLGRAARPAFALPRRIPLAARPKDSFDHLVLVGGRERGDNLHLLPARFANRWILKVHLGDKPRPAPATKPHELRVLVLDDNHALGSLRFLFLLDPAELPPDCGGDRAVGMNPAFESENRI